MKYLSSHGRLTMGVVTLCVAGIPIWWACSSHANEAASTGETAILRHEGERIVVPEHSPLRRTLAIAAVGSETLTAPFSLPASVEADPARLVAVMPPLAGRIVSMNKRLGDPVQAGDILFTLDSADYAQAQSDVQKAKASLELARKNLERQRKLDSDQLAATRDVEQASNDFEQAASELGRAQARLAQLGAKSGGTDGHLLAVRSPISGRVVDLAAAVGGYWNDANAAVMTVADLSSVFVTASAQEKDLPHVQVGQEVVVTLDAYPERPMTGKVRYVGEMLDADTRTAKVRMVFDNAAGQLKPGMFAIANFRGQTHQGVTIPLTAVVQTGFYSRTFVEVAPWQFVPRVLTLGTQDNDRVEILSGLKPGERVVVKEGVLFND